MPFGVVDNHLHYSFDADERSHFVRSGKTRSLKNGRRTDASWIRPAWLAGHAQWQQICAPAKQKQSWRASRVLFCRRIPASLQDFVSFSCRGACFALHPLKDRPWSQHIVLAV